MDWSIRDLLWLLQQPTWAIKEFVNADETRIAVDVNTPPAVVNVVEKRHFRSLTNSNILVLTALAFRFEDNNDYHLSEYLWGDFARRVVRRSGG